MSTTVDSPRKTGTGNSRNEGSELQPLVDIQNYVTKYARQKPEMCAVGCLLIGFVLGWKLKPW
jgi:hypothetical protein